MQRRPTWTVAFSRHSKYNQRWSMRDSFNSPTTPTDFQIGLEPRLWQYSSDTFLFGANRACKCQFPHGCILSLG